MIHSSKSKLVKAGIVLTLITSIVTTSMPYSVLAGGGSSSGGGGGSSVGGSGSGSGVPFGGYSKPVLFKTNLIIHKLKYDTEKAPEIKNTGEELQLQDGVASPYDANKYGKVGFTVYRQKQRFVVPGPPAPPVPPFPGGSTPDIVGPDIPMSPDVVVESPHSNNRPSSPSIPTPPDIVVEGPPIIEDPHIDNEPSSPNTNNGENNNGINNKKDVMPTLAELRNPNLYEQFGDEKFFKANTDGTSNTTVTFDKLPAGIYYIVETTTPKNTVVAPAEIIKLELPVTNQNGDEIIKNLHVYPKNKVQGVEFVLHKISENGEALNGINFDLYKGTPGSGKAIKSITTDQNGEIKIKITEQGLGLGDYYLVEKPTSGKVTKDPASDTSAEFLLGPSARNDERNEFRFSVTDLGIEVDSSEMTLKNYKKPDADKGLKNTIKDTVTSRGAVVPFVSWVKIPKDIAGGEAIVNNEKISTSPYYVFNYTDILTDHLLFPENNVDGVKKLGPKNLKVQIGNVELKENEDYRLLIKEGDKNNKPSFIIDFITRNVQDNTQLIEPQKPEMLSAPSYIENPVSGPIMIVPPKEPPEPNFDIFEEGSPEYLSAKANYETMLEQYNKEVEAYKKTIEAKKAYREYVVDNNSFSRYRDAIRLLQNNPKPSTHVLLGGPSKLNEPIEPSNIEELKNLKAPVPKEITPTMTKEEIEKLNRENKQAVQDFAKKSKEWNDYKHSVIAYNIYLAKNAQFEAYKDMLTKLDNLDKSKISQEEYEQSKATIFKSLPVANSLNKEFISAKSVADVEKSINQLGSDYLKDAKLYLLNREKEQNYNKAIEDVNGILKTLEKSPKYVDAINQYKKYVIEKAQYRDNLNKSYASKVSDLIKDNAGGNILITYELLVDGSATATDEIVNTMHMNYNNIPNTTEKTIKKSTRQKTNDLIIKKYSDDMFGATANKNKPLAGANFVLVRMPVDNGIDDPALNFSNIEIYAKNDKRGLPVWTNLKEAGVNVPEGQDIQAGDLKQLMADTNQFDSDTALFISNDNGEITLQGLDGDKQDYNYFFVETKAPKDHKLHMGFIPLNVGHDQLSVNTQDIVNIRKPNMPTTGSEKMLIGLGATVVLGAAAFGYEKHRKSKLKTQENHFEVK